MIRRALVALALVGLGWAVATAQSQAAPDSEIEVFTMGGKTTIECVRGCGLQWVERQVPSPTDAKPSFTYGPCIESQWPRGCPSGRLGVWIKR